METGYYPRKRERGNRGKYSPLVADVIARNYFLLRETLEVSGRGNHLSMSDEDVFSDTVLLVTHDPIAITMTEVELIAYFREKYKMIRYQLVSDARYIKLLEDADNKQTEED